MDTLSRILASIWWTHAEMAPYLLLGFAVAGLLSVTVSKAWVERHLGGRGIMPSLKAAVLGVPLPLCSCGVIPVAASMRQHGAGKGAVTSFLLSTPQTGVDSIFATYGLLGLPLAVIRPLIALVSGVVGGTIVDLRQPREQSLSLGVLGGSPAGDPAPPVRPLRHRLLSALRYAAITLPNDIIGSLVLGIVAAGVITGLAQPDVLEPYIGGPWGMAVMLVVGVPLYVCSTGSIPLAMGFIHLGATPGAALVFLVSGPATNAATLAVNWKVLGRWPTTVYLLTVLVASLAAGLLVDYALTPWLGSIVPPVDVHMHEHALPWWKHAAAGALTVLLITAWVVSRRPVRREGTTDADAAGQPQQTFEVTGMTCHGCVNAVTQAIRAQPGVAAAQVDLASGRATVAGGAVDRDEVVQAIERLGFRAKAV